MTAQLKDIENLIKLAITDENVSEFILNAANEGVDVEKIGNLFEKSLSQLERKNRGQFYTPREVVEYMTSYLHINENQKIVDPTCGCGSFLISIVDEVKKSGKKPAFSNIYGVDINKNAVVITQLSLIIKGGFTKECIEIFKKNIKVGNSILENKKLDGLALDWKVAFPDVMKNGGFDIGIGNPPYVTLKRDKDFDPNEFIYRSITKGPVNAATLMIGKGLSVLKDGGILAFVLPKTILHVNSYSKLRNYILKNTEIIHIFDLGIKFKDVRGEQIILIIKKEKPHSNHLVEIKTFNNRKKRMAEQISYYVPQKMFSDFDNKILVFENKLCYSILKKMLAKGKSLSELVEKQIFRGLPLNNKTVYNIDDVKEYEKIIRGKSISKFEINDIWYVYKKEAQRINRSRLQRVKNKKIVMQNIFSSESGIIAAYDSKGLLSLDTVTNVIVEDENFAKYLLGLLHSKLINFYIIFGLYNRGRLTMHLDKSYIGEIPIVWGAKKKLFNAVIALADRASTEKRNIKDILKAIDVAVYGLYGLNKNEIKIVENKMNKILSNKSRW